MPLTLGVLMDKDLLDLYSELDWRVAQALNSTPVACHRGCYKCCCLVTSIMAPEGDLIAQYLLEKVHDPRRLAKKLLKSATAMTASQTRTEYYSKKKVCALLDEDSKDCLVYSVRPASCRYYYVLDGCGDWNTDRTVMALNTMELEAKVWEFCLRKTGDYIGGPLPLLVLHSLAELSEDKYIRALAKRICTPREWIGKLVQGRGEFFSNWCDADNIALQHANRINLCKNA